MFGRTMCLELVGALRSGVWTDVRWGYVVAVVVAVVVVVVVVDSPVDSPVVVVFSHLVLGGGIFCGVVLRSEDHALCFVFIRLVRAPMP